MKTRFVTRCLPAALLALGFASSAGADEDLLGLPFEELARLQVTIATGTLRELATAPAAATVITLRELEAIGARDIGDALEAVPGLHVSNGSVQYGPRYFIRGITSSYNPHTLVLVNGIPQTSLFFGDRGERIPALYSLPVQLLDRIEIIRGPGSALYGADAFAGVINLITRSPVEARGGELTASTGSFATGTAVLQQSLQGDGIAALLSASWLDTRGDSSAVITHDAQTNVDLVGLAPPASLAPATVPTGAEVIDVRADIVAGNWRVRAGWMEARDTGAAQGLNDALDLTSTAEQHRGHLDIGWQAEDRWPDWSLDARLSYLYSDNRSNGTWLYPPGAVFGTFPDGVWARPNLFEENARADLSATRTGLGRHVLRLGTGFYWGDLFKTTTANNYVLVGGMPVPRPGGIADVSDTPAVFQPENQRTSAYVFAQDEWTLSSSWNLTSGLRYDRYDDFGGTVNPRFSLVWRATPTLSGKLIYGEAFRAPAFFELYGRSNPVALGNPALKPEKLRSLETGVTWKPTPTLSWESSVYVLRIDDFIDFVNDPGQPTFTARNSARIRGKGLETELRQQVTPRLEWLLNASAQQTRRDNGDALGLAPRQEAHLRAIWKAAPHWQVTPQLNWIGERERQAGDARPALAGYLTADLCIRYAPARRLDFALVGRNLADADVREPSRGPSPSQSQPSLPYDLPQAGRSLALEFSARW